MPRLNALWVLVACGYMVPFTSVGSLIAYFKATYGPHFYVQLYCAFYLPGWPVSELQRRFDESFDRKVSAEFRRIQKQVDTIELLTRRWSCCFGRGEGCPACCLETRVGSTG